jgi:hypothetical protein
MGHEPDYVPPPPSGNASPKQVGLIFGLALILVVFVLIAFYQSPEAIMQVGAFLIFLGLVFGAGLVSRNETVQFITAGIMMLGVGIAASLGINSGEWFWYVGAVLFILCAAIIVGKDRFLTDS